MKYNIVCLPGDGIGPEVASAVPQILDCIAKKYHHTFTIQEHLIGGIAIDKRAHPLPKITLEACQSADATFLGAIGGPKWDHSAIRPEQGLLQLRSELKVFANLRPLQLFSSLQSASPLKPEILKGTHFTIVRELTGGIYFGQRQQGLAHDPKSFAFDECRYSVEEISRVAHVAFKLAMQQKKHLTSVDKANVLATSKLWRSVVTQIGQTDYPEVYLEHQLVDSCAMKLIQSPSQFDIILTENLFGDILSDEASVLSGSMGLLASSSIGEKHGLFEPIHGSAPDIAGLGIANPYASILSIAMMLQWLNLPLEARAIEQSVESAIQAGILTQDLDPKSSITTQQAIDAVVMRIK
jgi:3-isopropylmalate dehydrogenase